MSPQTSGQKKFFARSVEILELLKALRESEQLWTIVLEPGPPSRARIVGPVESLTTVGGRLYLSAERPSAEIEGKTQNELNPLEAGWVQLDIGKEDDAALEMSSLAFKSPHATAASLFSRIKRTLTKGLTNGVFGCQGEKRRRYADLAFSAGALALFREGREWRPAYGGLVHFEPDVDAKVRAGMN